ncbi:MAG: hypothetical protein M3Q19_10765 [Pseudomonadota bacterium]|nr:hypothetical protein [Pseudomonadota bacterium]
MISSTSAMFRLADNFIQFAEGRGNLRSKLLVLPVIAGAWLMHRPAFYGPLNPNQGALNSIHGLFEGLKAHGSQGVAERGWSASG